MKSGVWVPLALLAWPFAPAAPAGVAWFAPAESPVAPRLAAAKDVGLRSNWLYTDDHDSAWDLGLGVEAPVASLQTDDGPIVTSSGRPIQAESPLTTNPNLTSVAPLSRIFSDAVILKPLISDIS